MIGNCNDFPSMKISKEQMMMKIFWKMSLLVTGHGFMVMILKAKDPNIGRVLLCLNPRKHDRCTNE
jgi:hypothetical protein